MSKLFMFLIRSTLLVVILSVVLMSSCSLINQKPNWISSPPKNTALGIAGTHIQGKSAQLELATQRARTEYAKKYGVQIKSNEVFLEFDNTLSSANESHSDTQITSNTVNVKVVVVKTWSDSKGNLYVLVEKK